MNSSVEAIPRPVPSWRSRWRILCLMLATVNLLALGISLAFSHRLTSIYSESARINREWSNRLGSAGLGQVAAAVNAAGHDWVDTQDEAVGLANLDKAMAQFEAKMRWLREEANVGAPEPAARALPQQMDAAQEVMNQMTGEARLTLTAVRDNQPDEAGKHMALMDRKFTELNAVLLRLQSDAREVQETRLANQLAQAYSARKI